MIIFVGTYLKYNEFLHYELKLMRVSYLLIAWRDKENGAEIHHQFFAAEKQSVSTIKHRF